MEELDYIINSPGAKEALKFYDNERLAQLCSLAFRMGEAGHAVDVVLSIMLPAAFKIGYEEGQHNVVSLQGVSQSGQDADLRGR